MEPPPRTTAIAAALCALAAFSIVGAVAAGGGEQPLSRIAIHRATVAPQPGAFVDASPVLLGLEGKDREWVTLRYSNPNPSKDDWIGVFSPANFNDSICPSENQWVVPPRLCTAPIKFQFANYSNLDYENSGKGSLRFQLINQREDFSFAQPEPRGHRIQES